ncbi:hypothetical protein RvY_01956 [Ramazzottius varieornatus]|uniref:DDE Tnp4 domain-containing protein n=1 Tax=Ramazzottius varieornatus TaxID=947166 RepID=A0A1D1ULX1_RAMVA|nr:hypothetical protein RvY_01956 [Ramazzottius varieornatus]
MPGTSERKRFIGDLEEWVVGRKLMKMNLDLDEHDNNDEVDVPTVLLQLVTATRYLQRPEVPKSKHFAGYLLPALDDGRFKEEIRCPARILRDLGFSDCVGMLDGTLDPLEYKPTKDGEDYWSHKSRCGISAMVVCDDKRKIRYMFIGFCGSAHYMKVFCNSMARQVSKLFSPGKYLLADSAYTTSTDTIASYKKPAAGVMSANNERFNFYHS